MNRTAARILFVTPELAPLAKAGGLGEVSRDLPRALAAAGLDVRILVPGYPDLLAAIPHARCVAEFHALGGAFAPARLLEARDPFPVYLIDCPHYYQRAGLYQSPEGNDWPDNHLRFGLLSRIAAILGGAGSPLGWQPHVIHCHDWQTGQELWKDQIAARPGGTTAWGSPVYADGRVYITDQQGNTTVFAAGPKYELVSLNRLGERCNASIAISQGNLFIRTHKHLWCVGKE